MGRDRCYCPDYGVGQVCHLDGDEARHLARVRRVTVGAEVEVFDGRGGTALAEVVGLGRDRVDLVVRQDLEGPRSPRVAVTLATAIPKGDRFDWLIEKATELGVEQVVPLITERSSVDPRTAKLDRLRRAVIEACKQSRRNQLMAISEPVRWEYWLDRLDPTLDHRWLAHPGGFAPQAARSIEAGSRVVVAIGPEGGFTDREREQALARDFEPITLTPTILRIETAAIITGAYLLI